MELLMRERQGAEREERLHCLVAPSLALRGAQASTPVRVRESRRFPTPIQLRRSGTTQPAGGVRIAAGK